MTIRTNEPQIFLPVVLPISIDVVNFQHQLFTVPRCSKPTFTTNMWNSLFNESTTKLISFSSPTIGS